MEADSIPRYGLAEGSSLPALTRPRKGVQKCSCLTSLGIDLAKVGKALEVDLSPDEAVVIVGGQMFTHRPLNKQTFGQLGPSSPAQSLVEK